MPVLSNTTVFTECKISRASADFIKIPFSAPLPVPTIIAVGVANPRAHGQDITKTDIPIPNANSKSPVKIVQTIIDSNEINITIGTNIPLILSANFAIGALDDVASSTSFIIFAKAVSSPTRLASNLKIP